MQFLLLFTLTLAFYVSAQTVYLIRHGEKPSDGSNGLSTKGKQRAQCLRNVFSSSSNYNIGYIIAEKPKSGNTVSLSRLLPTASLNTKNLFRRFSWQTLWDCEASGKSFCQFD